MKALSHALLLLGVFLFLSSCNKRDLNDEVDEGVFQEGTFTSDEIGWRITIPKGWKVVTKAHAEDLQSKGLEAMEASIGEEVDISGLKNLVNFQKDQFNIFQSTSEPFEEEYDGEWAENNVALREVVLDTYRGQGIEVEATEIEAEVIGGLEFQKFSMKATFPNNALVLHQIMYSRLMNGFDFGANISYTDEESGRVLLECWRASEFGVRSGAE